MVNFFGGHEKTIFLDIFRDVGNLDIESFYEITLTDKQKLMLPPTDYKLAPSALRQYIEKYISDLDFSDCNHDFDITAITDSWSHTQSDHYKYLMII